MFVKIDDSYFVIFEALLLKHQHFFVVKLYISINSQPNYLYSCLLHARVETVDLARVKAHAMRPADFYAGASFDDSSPFSSHSVCFCLSHLNHRSNFRRFLVTTCLNDQTLH